MRKREEEEGVYVGRAEEGGVGDGEVLERERERRERGGKVS